MDGMLHGNNKRLHEEVWPVFSSFLAVVVRSGVILLCRQTFCKLERFVANWVLLRLINIMALGLGCFAGCLF